MKNQKTILSTFWFLIVGSISATQAQVLWYADPDQPVNAVFHRLDTHGYESGPCADNAHPEPTVATPIDPRYGKVWAVNKPAGRKRAELARTRGLELEEGRTYYVGWRWKIVSSTPVQKGFAVFQWKTEPSKNTTDTQNYPFNLDYNNSTLSLNAYGPGDPDWTAGSSISNRRTTLWTQRVPPNRWISIVIGVKVSRDPAQGYLEVWFNGVKQKLTNTRSKEYQAKLSPDRTQAYHKTNDGKQVYMKWGSYGKSACLYHIVTFYDELKVATTSQAATP